MTAKEYLEQLKKIDTLIRNKLIEKKQWLDIATNITPNYNGDRVQGTTEQQKMAEAINKSVDIEQQINGYITEWTKKRIEILKTLEKLPEMEYDVLHKIYVQYKTLQEAADEKNISYSWVTTIHGNGLRHLNEILIKECKEKQ